MQYETVINVEINAQIFPEMVISSTWFRISPVFLGTQL